MIYSVDIPNEFKYYYDIFIIDEYSHEIILNEYSKDLKKNHDKSSYSKEAIRSFRIDESKVFGIFKSKLVKKCSYYYIEPEDINYFIDDNICYIIIG